MRNIVFLFLPLLLTACVDIADVRSAGVPTALPPDVRSTPEGNLVAAGRVVNVSDGDTLTVLDAANQTHKIRLQGIDAPEKGQPFGKKCKEVLSGRSIGQAVQVEARKRDKYGRIVGKVLVDGQDVGLAQILDGCAWHYVAYAKEQPAAERASYAAAEQQARAAQLGLWQDPNPQAPWDYRKAQRQD